MSTLTIRSFHVSNVIGTEDEFFLRPSDAGDRSFVLGVPCRDVDEYLGSSPLLSDIRISVIPPGAHHVYTESIMDIFPVSVKVLGCLGEGITHTMTGVYVMITGVDTAENPVCAFGSSAGMLDEQMMTGRAGTPEDGDFLISFAVTLKENAGYSRSGPDAVHEAADMFCQHIRRLLAGCQKEHCSESYRFEDIVRPGKKKVALVKLVSGQGAMYDTRIFPREPSGFSGGRSVIDLGCMPVLLTANQYRDGALRAVY